MVKLQLTLATVAMIGFICVSDAWQFSLTPHVEEEFDIIIQGESCRDKLGEKYAYEAVTPLFKLFSSSRNNTMSQDYSLEGLAFIADFSTMTRDRLASTNNLLMDLARDNKDNPDLLFTISAIVCSIATFREPLSQPKSLVPPLKQLIKSTDCRAPGFNFALDGLEFLLSQRNMETFYDQELALQLVSLLNSTSLYSVGKAFDILESLISHLPDRGRQFTREHVLPKLMDSVVNPQSTDRKIYALKSIENFILSNCDHAQAIVNADFEGQLEKLPQVADMQLPLVDLSNAISSCSGKLDQK